VAGVVGFVEIVGAERGGSRLVYLEPDMFGCRVVCVF